MSPLFPIKKISPLTTKDTYKKINSAEIRTKSKS